MKTIYFILKVAVEVPDTAVLVESDHKNWSGFIRLEDGSEFSINPQMYWIKGPEFEGTDSCH